MTMRGATTNVADPESSSFDETPPDLSRGGLDGRYVESACPELDAATRELATTLAARRARAIARARARATRTGKATGKVSSLRPPGCATW